MQKSQFIKRLKKIFPYFLITVIRIYQLFISPVFPSCCRFTPVCSVYAIETIRKHGVFKGLFFTSKRILRCNPFCKGGMDSVP